MDSFPFARRRVRPFVFFSGVTFEVTNTLENRGTVESSMEAGDNVTVVTFSYLLFRSLFQIEADKYAGSCDPGMNADGVLSHWRQKPDVGGERSVTGLTEEHYSWVYCVTVSDEIKDIQVHW